MTSIIKVDNLQNQCGANIISESANVITIGASGDTVTLAAGASQSGFGRSGSVNWDTTPKTSSPVTAVSGNGYFINTTSGAITVTLPATPSAGDIVAIADYNGTAFTNNITVGRNSSNINGSAADLTITQNYSAVTLVYVNATSGWRSVDSSSPFDITAQPEYVTATGGTITTSGNFKIHTFTGPGTFTVTSAGNPLGSTAVDYLVVAGGGAGGNSQNAGGGGAGGYRTTFPSPGCNAGSFPITATAYPITVGGGGAAVPTVNTRGASGTNSIFSTITSTGGGGGGGAGAPVPERIGSTGGSGGGGALNCGTGGAGNTPPVSPSQGNNGGNSAIPSPANAPGYGAGGGGGAGAVGSVGTSGPGTGAGGAGSANSITGSPVTYAGGGGGGNNAGTAPGGSGVGGAGGFSSPAGTGTVNTGSGGGGSGGSAPVVAGSGGSGIVVIRYKFQ
jgi:hypothetical protein